MAPTDQSEARDAAAQALFAGPGEVRARCRAIDWAATPLGEVGGWPTHLRAAVAIIMGSPQPMWIGWGADLIQLYNDAYLPFSERNPASLGQSARQTWADIWHVIGADLEQVLTGGPPVHHEDHLISYHRGGEVQDVYFSFSYSAIPDAEMPHSVGGVLSVAVETTARVELTRALQASESRQAYLLELSDALRPLGDAADIQAVACRILGEHIGANQAHYGETFGDEVVIHRGYGNGLPPMVGTFRHLDLGARLITTYRAGITAVCHDVSTDATITAAESAVITGAGFRAYLAVPIVKVGEWVATLAVHSVQPRVWTAGEIALVEETAQRTWAAVERARTQRALRESEAMARTLVAHLPGGAVFVVDRHMRYVLAEGEALGAAGMAPADLVGKTLFEALDPAHAESYAPMYRRALDGDPFAHEHEAHGRVFVSRGAPLRDEAGVVYAALAVSYDITERRRAEAALKASEERQAFLLALSDRVRSLSDARQIMTTAAEMLGRHLGVALVQYLLVDEDGDAYRVAAGYTDGCLPAADTARGRIADHGADWGLQLRTGVAVFSEDHEKRSPRGAAESREPGVRSGSAVPLLRDGQLAAILTTGHVEARRWTEVEKALQREVAERTWAAVERADAATALVESEGKYRSLFEAMGQGYDECEMIRDAEGRAVDYRIIEMNPAFERLVGVRAAEARGRTAREIIPGLEDWWVRTFDEVVRTGEPRRIEHEVAPLGVWYEVLAYPRRGDRFVALLDDITERKRAEATLHESEERQSFLLALSDALRPLSDAVEIQGATARLLREHFAAGWCYYVELDDAQALITVSQDSVRDGLPSMVGRHPFHDMPEFLAEWRAGRPIRVEDFRGASLLSERAKQRYLAAGINAFLGVPVLKRGVLIAALILAETEPQSWSQLAIDLTVESAERTWAAVERARAEATLRETQRRLDETLATARMAYWQWDPANGRTVASPSMDDLFGLFPGDRFGSGAQVLALVHPDDRARYGALVDGARQRGEGWHVEFRIVRPRDGEIAYLEEVATVARDPQTDLPHTTGLVWDVTDRKRSEAAAERERAMRDRDTLRRQLVQAEEAERRRLARELHDQLGQELTAVQLGLDDAARLAATYADADAPLIRRLAQLRTLAASMTAGARHVALELRPPELDDVGLESALATYVREWSARYGVAAEVAASGEEGQSIPPEVGSALYRIAQEALTNVAKHAAATQVSVIVESRHSEVRMIIEDDGRGFELDAMVARARADRRLGLDGMRERAALLGGEVSVESSEGAGTTVYVQLPTDRRPTPGASDAVPADGAPVDGASSDGLSPEGVLSSDGSRDGGASR